MASKLSENDDAEPMIFTNYKPTLYKRFAEMFHLKQLTDAVLICENQRIHVHKFLLSASSSFFNRMFKKPNASILHIRNVKYVDLLTALEYVYKGELALPKERIGAFLDAAQKLSIPINEKDIESVTLKWGLTFEQQNQNQDDDPDTNDDGDDDVKSCDEPKKPLIVKRSERCETIRIDKHNLHDENLKRIIPGVVEVSRDEFFKRMFGVSKSTKKSNHNPSNNNNNINQAETKQNSSNRPIVDPAVPSTSNGPNAGIGGSGGGGAPSDEKIRMLRTNIEALRKRIMRNNKKDNNNKQIEKDRLTLIKLEASLVKALKHSSG